MQGKIDEELPFDPSANFYPMYPMNGWPIFEGLFSSFYEALDDLCEFKAPNVLQCGVGRRVKDILRTLKRYLSKMGLITWSPEQLQSWFENQGKIQESRNSKKIRGKQNLKIKEQTQYTNKKKRQSEAFRDAPGVKPKLKTQQQLPSRPQDYKVPWPGQGNNKREKKDKKQDQKTSRSSSSSQPFVCGKCLKQYKNIRSYRTHMYQAHNKQVPKDSSHDIHGKAFVRAVPLQPKPSTKQDQLQQPRQDLSRQLTSSHSQIRDSEMIEETPQGQIIHGRKADGSKKQLPPFPIPPKGKKK